jgi:hypothetical protein
MNQIIPQATRRTFLRMGILSTMSSALFGCGGRRGASQDLKLQVVESLPIGLKVTHEPNPVRDAVPGGRSGQQFTWLHSTKVEALSANLRVVEFGAFAWRDGGWHFTTYAGRPFTSSEFADWYGCRGAMLFPGKVYTDPSNWTGTNVLRSTKIRWYFIGLDASSRLFRGDAVVELLA